jgi:hypothetical protein
MEGDGEEERRGSRFGPWKGRGGWLFALSCPGHAEILLVIVSDRIRTVLLSLIRAGEGERKKKNTLLCHTNEKQENESRKEHQQVEARGKGRLG